MNVFFFFCLAIDKYNDFVYCKQIFFLLKPKHIHMKMSENKVKRSAVKQAAVEV